MHFHVDITCSYYFVYLAILTIESFYTKVCLIFHLFFKRLFVSNRFVFLTKFYFSFPFLNVIFVLNQWFCFRCKVLFVSIYD